MRAAVIVEPGTSRLEEVRLPEPASDQVRVRLEGSGVCGSNLPVWEGRDWFRYPLEPGAPGHEGWGRIDAVGSGVHDLAVGDRVGLVSTGAFAEYDVASARGVARLPAELDGRPFPAEPLGCAVNVFRRSGIVSGESVAVVGVGFLGALLVRLASRAGARVTALSRRPFALEIAEEMGAEAAVPLGGDDAAAVDRARSGGGSAGRGFDCVIEAAGKQRALDVATALTRVRGRLVIAGYHQDGRRTVDLQLWNWNGLDVANAHERDPDVYREGMAAAARAVAAGDLDLGPLLTHTYPLEDLGAALDSLRSRPPRFLKAIAVP